MNRSWLALTTGPLKARPGAWSRSAPTGTNHALMVADRAVRKWAANAIARARPGVENRFESLPRLAKPEYAHNYLDGALEAERKDEHAIPARGRTARCGRGAD